MRASSSAVMPRFMRGIQYSKDAGAGYEKPRCTGYPACAGYDGLFVLLARRSSSL